MVFAGIVVSYNVYCAILNPKPHMTSHVGETPSHYYHSHIPSLCISCVVHGGVNCISYYMKLLSFLGYLGMMCCTFLHLQV